MPTRSNEFQRLIYLVKSQLAETATVTESKMLADRLTRSLREVDVCIESSVGGHPVTISIECRDRSRPANVSWIEEMKAKHERLPTNALVLVSKSGFTKEARRLAELSGIELLHLDEISATRVDALFRSTNSLWGKTFHLSPTKVVAVVASVGSIPGERVRLFPDNYLFAPPGNLLGTAHQVVASLLKTQRSAELLGRDGDESHSHFIVQWDTPRTTSGERLHLEKIEPRLFVPIDSLEITGTCKFSVCEFRLRKASLGAVSVAWGRGELEGHDAMLVAVAGGGSVGDVVEK